MLNTIDTTQADIPASLAKAKPEESRRMKIWLDERIAAGKKKPLVEIVTLTPVLAALILEHNSSNRPISKRNATELRQDIANGRFAFNGEGIIISDTGILNDGQHRCQAVIDTGVSIPTVICFGPKEDTRFTVDSGRSKTVSNYLAMKGRVYTHVLGAAAGYIVQWREHGGIYGSNDERRPSKAAILDAADELRGLDTSVEFTAPAMKTVRCHAVLAFCHFAFVKKSGREAADEFMLKLIEGDGLRKGDPILYCRNRLLGMGRGIHAHVRSELIIKCWNAHRAGHGIDHFKLSGSMKLPKIEK